MNYDAIQLCKSTGNSIAGIYKQSLNNCNQYFEDHKNHEVAEEFPMPSGTVDQNRCYKLNAKKHLKSIRKFNFSLLKKYFPCIRVINGNPVMKKHCNQMVSEESE